MRLYQAWEWSLKVSGQLKAAHQLAAQYEVSMPLTEALVLGTVRRCSAETSCGSTYEPYEETGS